MSTETTSHENIVAMQSELQNVEFRYVLNKEMDYIKERRERNDLEKNTENLWGLCLSGGGIRAATLGLGAIQAFTKAGKFKLFDYLSTVSGGGYIGSCL